MTITRRDFLRMAAVGGASLMWSRLVLPTHAQDTSRPPRFFVYLTFDDGPTTFRNGRGPTAEVLDILKASGVPATFFLHGVAINAWESAVLARMIREGHAIGNHLWTHWGNTVADQPTLATLAQQYILAEQAIRNGLRQGDPAMYYRYLSAPRLFRRPGGNNGLTPFLALRNYPVLARTRSMQGYLRHLPWLKGVYDYSGWHINSGDSVPKRLRPADAEAALRWVLKGGQGGYFGVESYLCAGEPPHRAREVADGLIILMHDASAVIRAALPSLIAQLRARGAIFRALPRPVDFPNAATVGIGYAPTLDSAGVACSGQGS